jgi:hypothetical protein
LDYTREDREAKYVTIQAVLLKTYSSVYVTIPSAVRLDISTFVERLGLRSALVLSGELVDNSIQKCCPTDSGLPIAGGLALLSICDSLQSSLPGNLGNWQSACLFRQERLLVVWSGGIGNLPTWARDVERYLRHLVCSRPKFDLRLLIPKTMTPFEPSHISLDGDGNEIFELSNANEASDEPIKTNSERHPTYGDAIISGFSVMSVCIILIGVLGKTVSAV